MRLMSGLTYRMKQTEEIDIEEDLPLLDIRFRHGANRFQDGGIQDDGVKFPASSYGCIDGLLTRRSMFDIALDHGQPTAL